MSHEADIQQRARTMAATGKYRSWRSIETVLRGERVKGVKTALDDAFIRRELDLTCQGQSTYDL